MHYIIYDIEIARAIPDRGKPPEPDIHYCEGWTDYAGMGIACLVAYDSQSGRYRVFCEDNKQEFKYLLERAQLVAGFNHINFDNRVLLASWGFEVPATSQYDILQEIWIANGLDPTRFNPRTHGGFGLDACSEKNFGTKKSGNGALAPIDWQRGKVGSVIDYGINDVVLTKALFDRISFNRSLICPKTNQELLLRNPFAQFDEDDDCLF